MIVVDRFQDVAGTSTISDGVTGEVISKLVKFKEILVVDGGAAHEESVAVRNARFALQGSVRRDGERILAGLRAAGAELSGGWPTMTN